MKEVLMVFVMLTCALAMLGSVVVLWLMIFEEIRERRSRRKEAAEARGRVTPDNAIPSWPQEQNEEDVVH